MTPFVTACSFLLNRTQQGDREWEIRAERQQESELFLDSPRAKNGFNVFKWLGKKKGRKKEKGRKREREKEK